MTIAISAEHRRLTHEVATASDKALAGIVALFDSMPDRREADGLLDAVRPRLHRLRPPRPIGSTRLLFVPLNGAIVETRLWRRQDGGLPRSALPPIAAAVCAAIGEEAAAIGAMTAGRNFGDLRAVDAAGRRLWRAAAAVAPSLAQPAAWGATGLTPADFRHAMTISAGVWRHADPVWAAIVAAPAGPPEALVHEALSAAAAEDPMVPEAILATLLLKAARPGSVATAASVARITPAGTAERMLDRWLDGCSPDISVTDPQGSARLAEEFVEAFDDLEACTMGRQPDRRRRIAALRRDVGEACCKAFTEGASADLLAPLARSGTAPDDGAMEAMEGKARALKRLERAGRKFGGGPAYDAALRPILDEFGRMRTVPGANAADLARLTEILAGPEAALRLLDEV